MIILQTLVGYYYQLYFPNWFPIHCAQAQLGLRIASTCTNTIVYLWKIVVALSQAPLCFQCCTQRIEKYGEPWDQAKTVVHSRDIIMLYSNCCS